MQSNRLELTMQKEPGRILWIDYSKFVGILFVIMGHLLLENYKINIWIYSFHIPLFFFISGYFEKDNLSIKESIKKSAKSLLLPYAFFSIISYIVWLGTTFYRNPEMYERNIVDAFLKPMAGILFAENSGTPLSTVVNMSLWFFVGLFFCKLIFRLGLTICKDRFKSIILLNIIAISITILYHFVKYDIYWSIDSAINLLPFFSLGFLFKHKIEKLKFGFITNLLLSIMGFSLCWLFIEIDGFRSLSAVKVSNFPLFYITGVVGSLSIIYFGFALSKWNNKILLFFGKNTLVIFAVHMIVANLLMGVYRQFMGIRSAGLLSTAEGLIFTIVILLISSIAVFIMKRYFPYIIGEKRARN